MAKNGASLTINVKLGLIFIGLLTIFLGFGGFTIVRMSDMNDHSDDIRTNWLPSIRVVDDLNVAISEFRLIQARHILNTDDNAMRGIERELDEKVTQIRNLQKSLRTDDQQRGRARHLPPLHGCLATISSPA